MAKRIRIGDVVEVPTAKGLAYAQCSHRHPKYGHLIRALPGFHAARPASLSETAELRESFSIFFPLQAAVNRGIFEVVGNVPVPEFARAFPLFRTAVVDPRTKQSGPWWLWDGKKEWMVGTLTETQWDLPLRLICNDTMLVERFEDCWDPGRDPVWGR